MSTTRKSNAGRKTKLTPTIQKAFCDQLITGAHIDTAARACGLNPTSIYEWLNRGRDEPDSPFAEFSKAVERAKADVVQRLLARAHQRVKSRKDGGEGADPLPLLAIVDKRYSPQVRVQVNSELDAALEKLEKEFNEEPETYERILACLADDTGAIEIAGAKAGSQHSQSVSGEGIRAAQAIAATANIPGD